MLLLLLLSRFSRVRLCVTPQTEAHQAPPSWDSPGENTGVGCHFLLQCMKVKSEREVAQSCPTLSDPMDYSLPGSSIHGIFQARVLEWGTIAFSNHHDRPRQTPAVSAFHDSAIPVLPAQLLAPSMYHLMSTHHYLILSFKSISLNSLVFCASYISSTNFNINI